MAEDRERVRNISNPERRQAFLAGRRLLETTLPGSLSRLGIRPDGKPVIRMPGAAPFSISHSGKRIVCAGAEPSGSSDIREIREIGVDIERQRRRPRLFANPGEFFHPDEVTWLSGRSEAEFADAFYFLWTVKEAIGKGTGRGMAGFRDFSVVWNQRESCGGDGSHGCWNYRHWRLPGPWHLAVAWLGPAGCDTPIYRLSADGLFSNPLNLNKFIQTEGQVSLPILYC